MPDRLTPVEHRELQVAGDPEGVVEMWLGIPVSFHAQRDTGDECGCADCSSGCPLD